MPSTFPCPKCGEYHYHKSHSQNNFERLRKKFLRQRVYRCHVCGYRHWERKKTISSELTPRKLLIYCLVGLVAVVFGLLCRFIII